MNKKDFTCWIKKDLVEKINKLDWKVRNEDIYSNFFNSAIPTLYYNELPFINQDKDKEEKFVESSLHDYHGLNLSLESKVFDIIKHLPLKYRDRMISNALETFLIVINSKESINQFFLNWFNSLDAIEKENYLNLREKLQVEKFGLTAEDLEERKDFLRYDRWLKQGDKLKSAHYQFKFMKLLGLRKSKTWRITEILLYISLPIFLLLLFIIFWDNSNSPSD